MSPIFYGALLLIAGVLGVAYLLGFSEARHEQSHGVEAEDESFLFAENNIVGRGR